MLLREVAARPLYARVATSNVGAIRAPEKCGYPEGCPTARTAPREVLADTSSITKGNQGTGDLMTLSD